MTFAIVDSYPLSLLCYSFNYCQTLSDDETSELMHMYDANGDGRIKFDEFVEIVADLGFLIDRDSFIEASDVVGVVVVAKPEEDKKEVVKAVEEEKFILLSSIADEDLRMALAPFDKKGDGTIDLRKVLEAAEGNIPQKLHWSENRPRIGLSDHVRAVNHIAILVSDVAKSTHFYRNIIGLEQVSACLLSNIFPNSWTMIDLMLIWFS